MHTSVIPPSIGGGRPIRTMSPFCKATGTKPRQPKASPSHGAVARSVEDVCVSRTPLVIPTPAHIGGGPIADAFLSLRDAPVLPAGGGEASARLHDRHHHEHRG